jgi:hypothetical protein
MFPLNAILKTRINDCTQKEIEDVHIGRQSIRLRQPQREFAHRCFTFVKIHEKFMQGALVAVKRKIFQICAKYEKQEVKLQGKQCERGASLRVHDLRGVPPSF